MNDMKTIAIQLIYDCTIAKKLMIVLRSYINSRKETLKFSIYLIYNMSERSERRTRAANVFCFFYFFIYNA